MKKLRLDHIGLQFKEISQVEKVRNELLHISKGKKPLSSAMINGRQIFIFELEKPLNFGNWQIPCVELPYPKPKHIYADGWEHIEFVIPSSASTVDELRQPFISQFPNLQIEELQEKGWYSEALPIASVKELPNPAIILRKDSNLAVKFHPRTIKEVVLSTNSSNVVQNL